MTQYELYKLFWEIGVADEYILREAVYWKIITPEDMKNIAGFDYDPSFIPDSAYDDDGTILVPLKLTN